MNRRLFLQYFAVASALVPFATHAEGATDPLAAANDFAAATWRASASAEIRLVFVRVSRWSDSNAAARFCAFALNQAGSDLPQGEFYQTEPVELAIPSDRLASPAIGRGWQTIVGAAGFTTDHVLLVVQRDDLVWEIHVGGAIEANVQGIALDLAVNLVDLDPSLPLVELLPDPDEGPGGIDFDSLVTHDGTFNDQGTPQASLGIIDSR